MVPGPVGQVLGALRLLGKPLTVLGIAEPLIMTCPRTICMSRGFEAAASTAETPFSAKKNPAVPLPRVQKICSELTPVWGQG